MERTGGTAGGGPGGIGVGRAVAAAAVAGAAAATLAALDGRRLAVFFLRWARDTGRAKAEAEAGAAAAAAEAALAAAGAEAQREREAWESLQATLEGSAAAREREAKEAAEDAGRKVRESGAEPLTGWWAAVGDGIRWSCRPQSLDHTPRACLHNLQVGGGTPTGLFRRTRPANAKRCE